MITPVLCEENTGCVLCRMCSALPRSKEKNQPSGSSVVRGRSIRVYIGIFQSLVCWAAVVLLNDPIPFAGSTRLTNTLAENIVASSRCSPLSHVLGLPGSTA